MGPLIMLVEDKSSTLCIVHVGFIL